MKNIFEHKEGDYYKPVKVINFWIEIILNMKTMVIEIKHYQLKNGTRKLDQI